eukprot:gene10097-10253_t
MYSGQQQQEPFSVERCKVLYAAGPVGCTGVASEDCVVAYNNQAIWTSGRTVRKRFTVDSVILQKNSVTCIYPTGEVLEAPLLQPCQMLWPLPVGVLLVGPSDSYISLLTHPLEEPQPVVADCSINSSCYGTGADIRSNVAAFSGWSQEQVIWSSTQLPFVATYNEARGKLSIWHACLLPKDAAGIGSSYDLPVVSPMGLLQPRTPLNTLSAAAMAGIGSGADGGYSTGGFGGVGTGWSALGSAGAVGVRPAGAGSAAYLTGSNTAAFTSSVLDPLVAGATPATGAFGGSFASAGGASSVKRSSLRTPQGCLPPSVFDPTPRQSSQAPWAGGLGALGLLRPGLSNTTAAQQAMLLPGRQHSCLLSNYQGQLQLHRGPWPLVAVNFTLPQGCIRHLHQQRQQLMHQSLVVVSEDHGAAGSRPGTAGSLGCKSMSEGSLDSFEPEDRRPLPEAGVPQTQELPVGRLTAAAAGPQRRQEQHQAAGAVLQALQEVLPEASYMPLLAACLAQPVQALVHGTGDPNVQLCFGSRSLQWTFGKRGNGRSTAAAAQDVTGGIGDTNDCCPARDAYVLGIDSKD